MSTKRKTSIQKTSRKSLLLSAVRYATQGAAEEARACLEVLKALDEHANDECWND